MVSLGTKPPAYLKKIVRRKLKRKPLTIAAGFVCLDGIVLCADTQETVIGYTKNNTEKIRVWQDMGLNIAITGAGNSELIETIGGLIQSDLAGDYSQSGSGYDSRSVKERIQRVVLDSFDKFIAPYANFPADDRPFVDLLIVVLVASDIWHYQSLFKASGTTVREIECGSDCIGTGLIMAKSLAERFYSPFMDLDELVLAVCYIMFQTKKWVDGCGGNTDLIIASKEKQFFGGIASRDIELLERQFEAGGSLNSLLLDFLNPNLNEERIESLISHAKGFRNVSKEALYFEGSRLLETLNRLAPNRPTRTPTQSDSQTSKDQQ
jgi:20S proteasome alpha/beta subunit